MEKQLDFCSTVPWESIPADECKHTYVHMYSQAHWHTHAEGSQLEKKNERKKNAKNLGREKWDWVVNDSCGHI